MNLELTNERSACVAKKINPEEEQKERPLRTENKAIASSLFF